MEQNNIPTTKEPMSTFCEALMDVTAPLCELHQNSDTALVICTDGVNLACRQVGNYPEALRMIFSKMLADDKFAELIVEAAMHYARRTIGKSAIHVPFKEDTPIAQPTN